MLTMPQKMLFPLARAAVKSGRRVHFIASRDAEGNWVVSYVADGQDGIYALATDRSPLEPRTFSRLDAIANLLKEQSAELDTKFCFTVSVDDTGDATRAVETCVLNTAPLRTNHVRQGVLPLR